MFCQKPTPSAQAWLSVQRSPPCEAQVCAAIGKTVACWLLQESTHTPCTRGPGQPVSKKPLAPAAPVAPVGPVVPGAPVGPVGPAAPGSPAVPVEPVGPVAPGGPVGPVGPGAPAPPVSK